MKLKTLFRLNFFNTGIGMSIIASIISFVSIFTIVIPLFSGFYNYLILTIISLFIDENNYDLQGITMIIVLSVLTIFYTYMLIINQELLLKNRKRKIIIFIFFYFVNHSLSYYLIYLFFNEFYNLKDGQAVFTLYELNTTYLTMAQFIIEGVLFDVFTKYYFNKRNTNS